MDKGVWDKICSHQCNLPKSSSSMQENVPSNMLYQVKTDQPKHCAVWSESLLGTL